MRRVLRALGRIKWYWWVGGALVMGIAWLVILRVQGYVWADWTKFEGKGVWDVMELLIIPVTLAGVAAYLDKLERKTDREIAEKRAETDRRIALSNQRETALQNYFNFMTELVLHENLRESDPEDEIREIARAKTITTLHGLDKEHKKKLIEFLVELKLITGDIIPPIISLNTANLEKINLCGANLEGIDLERARMDGARLEEARLEGANLRGVYLLWADLQRSHLERAALEWAHLEGAHLEWAHLEGVNLQRAYLWEAHLEDTDLRDADLKDAHLEGAVFDGATMPDGERYDPEVHTVEKLTRGERGGV